MAAAGPQGPFHTVWTFPYIYFACNLELLANAIQHILSVFLHIPHDSICSDFPCLQQTPSASAACWCVNLKKANKLVCALTLIEQGCFVCCNRLNARLDAASISQGAVSTLY